MTRPVLIRGVRLGPNAIDPPTLFYGMKQLIFRYIWNDPGCTAMEIAAALYPNTVDNHRSVHTHIEGIERALTRHTPWRLVVKRVHGRNAGQPPKTFKITKRTTANARSYLATSLS